MKATLVKTIRRANFSRTYVFTVQGAPDELTEYKQRQGQHYREDSNNVPLFFSGINPRMRVGQTTDLNLNHDGSAYRLDDERFQQAWDDKVDTQVAVLEAQEIMNQRKYGAGASPIVVTQDGEIVDESDTADVPSQEELATEEN